MIASGVPRRSKLVPAGSSEEAPEVPGSQGSERGGNRPTIISNLMAPRSKRPPQASHLPRSATVRMGRMRCFQQSPRPSQIRFRDLGNAEIHKLESSIIENEDIRWFQVSMNDPTRVSQGERTVACTITLTTSPSE